MELLKLFRLVQLIESSFADGKISESEAKQLLHAALDFFYASNLVAKS